MGKFSDVVPLSEEADSFGDIPGVLFIGVPVKELGGGATTHVETYIRAKLVPESIRQGIVQREAARRKED